MSSFLPSGITLPFFELQAADFVWKFEWIVQTNYKSTKSTKSTKVQKDKSIKIQKGRKMKKKMLKHKKHKKYKKKLTSSLDTALRSCLKI